MKHLARLALLTTAIFLLSGCEVLVARAASDFNITAETSNLSVVQGGEVSVKLTVTKPINLDVIPMPISVRLDDPPAGVSAEDLVIEPGDDDGNFVVTASERAAVGPEALELIATNGLVTKKVALELTITAKGK